MEHNTTSSNILVVWWALCGEERWIMINQLMIITVSERESRRRQLGHVFLSPISYIQQLC
jgi:hypothetical protein